MSFAKKSYLFGFVICCVSLGVALYLQYGLGFEPCPLCVFQRVVMMAMGGCFLLALPLTYFKFGRIFVTSLLTLLAGLGMFFAVRHIMIQHAPAGAIPDCGPSLSYLYDSLPFQQFFMYVLKGSGECAKINWQFLGITIAGWTGLLFMFLGAISIFPMCVRHNK